MSIQLEAPANTTPQKWPLIVAFALIWSGLSFTEQVSIHLLAPTVETFTTRPFLIALVMFLNPLFGMIAQPLVGILSDRIWTPLGRRAFFLITCAPLVGICLWLIPEARLFWHLFVLILLLQFFQDILWGSDHPLVADLFPPKQRLFMVGLLICVGQVSSMLFLRYGLPNFEADELFRIIAIVQLVLVSGLSFFLNEKPVRKRDRPKLSVKRYLNDLMAHPVRRKFAMLNFTLAMVLNLAITGGMLALFVKHNLGASQAEYGANWAWSSMVPLLFSVPVAIVIEKYISKRWALGGGFFVMVVALSIGWFAQTMYHFYLMALTWGVGFMLVQVTYKPFFTEYIPSDIIGQVSGALNICYGLGRALAILISGFAVDYLFNDNYRYMFPMGIVSIWISLSIRDLRYEDRKKARA